MKAMFSDHKLEVPGRLTLIAVRIAVSRHDRRAFLFRGGTDDVRVNASICRSRLRARADSDSWPEKLSQMGLPPELEGHLIAVIRVAG
jgi:hypothetical protein